MSATDLLRLEELAERAGVPTRLVRRFVVLGLLDPADEEPGLFPVEATLRVQRIVRLRRDLGVNFQGAALALDLAERIEVLEARLRQLDADR